VITPIYLTQYRTKREDNPSERFGDYVTKTWALQEKNGDLTFETDDSAYGPFKAFKSEDDKFLMSIPLEGIGSSLNILENIVIDPWMDD
jgi:hypothetical protein